MNRIAIIFLFIISISAQQPGVYISLNGDDELGDGSINKPFKSFNKAYSLSSKDYKILDNENNLPESIKAFKWVENQDFPRHLGYDKYSISIPIYVMDGEYRISDWYADGSVALSHIDGNHYYYPHIQQVISLSGYEKTILKPDYNSRPSLSPSQGLQLIIDGFTVDSLSFSANGRDAKIWIQNSLVSNISKHDQSSTEYGIKYFNSVLTHMSFLNKGNGIDILNSIISKTRDEIPNISNQDGLDSYMKLLRIGYSINDFHQTSNFNKTDDPLFCNNGTYKYYDNSPAVDMATKCVLVNGADLCESVSVGLGIGCGLPSPFKWVSSASDTINISQSNLADTYTLQWDPSFPAVEGTSINYLVYAKIGQYPAEEIFDTTATDLFIPYQEIVEGVFEGLPGNRATVHFSVWAHDGTDSVQVGGEDRVLYVNRYEYLSIEGDGVPNEFALHENYPNPFNPTTQIRFDLPEMGNVTLTIYNMLGQKVRTFTMQSAQAGYHALTWNATNDLGAPVSGGVYLYQLQTKGFTKTKKMVLLK